MRVFIETAFSGILRGNLLSVHKANPGLLQSENACVRITSRGRAYECGASYVFPLTQVTPAHCFRIARQRGSGKLYLRCTQDHSRVELFAPYRQEVKA